MLSGRGYEPEASQYNFYEAISRTTSILYGALSILIAMENQLIFDLTNAGYPWRCLVIGLAVAGAIGLAAMFATPRSDLRHFCIASSSLFLIWIGVLAGTTYPTYSALAEAEQHGNLSVVEGTVSDFHRGAGFSKERFCVDRQCFQYTPEPLPVSFMNSPLQGGPVIRDGLHVRIASAGNAIVRLEVVENRRTAAR